MHVTCETNEAKEERQSGFSTLLSLHIVTHRVIAHDGDEDGLFFLSLCVIVHVI